MNITKVRVSKAMREVLLNSYFSEDPLDRTAERIIAAACRAQGFPAPMPGEPVEIIVETD